MVAGALGVCCLPGILLGGPCVSCRLILMIALYDGDQKYTHFTDKVTEAQGVESLAQVTQLTNGRMGTPTHASGSTLCFHL